MTAANPVENLEVLNSETHKNLKVKQLDNATFASGWNNTQVLPSEFAQVAKEMPIIFAQNGTGGLDAVAVMAVKDSHNLFVKSGTWKANYMPATLRQYPFILARPNAESTEYVLCYDKTASCIGTKIKGERLFAEDGEQTETAKNLINFISEVQKEASFSDAIVNKLTEYELFKDIEGRFELNDGEKITLQGMRVVDEEKLKNLDAEKLSDLNKSGVLFLIHMHLLSLSNFGHLMDMYAKQKPKSA